MRRVLRTEFQTGDICGKLVDVPYQTLVSWVNKEWVVPSVDAAEGSGSTRRFDFLDVLLIAVLDRLRRLGVRVGQMEFAALLYQETRRAYGDIQEGTRLVLTGDGDADLIAGESDLLRVLRRQNPSHVLVLLSLPGREQKEHQQHLLRETETTMKFGLFSMVQNYLHAMRLVQREKESWSGRGNTIGRDSDGSSNRACLTLERKKMVQVRFFGTAFFYDHGRLIPRYTIS